ncbi:putative baseplate assembly protein [Paraburkholderia sp. BCC1886]|uniref:putative baseplate assembly protein n=1 Tax=Paraburkholderia sp. BCC1886 TaxID=2562670 RepID=UPI00118310F1|nr:putative baseplate assembly protein [Paraburkholderia sp. BCC1886]
MSRICSCSDAAAQSGDSATPALFNRPGLPALTYRCGTYGSFFDAMIVQLGVAQRGVPTTREPSDPAIALLDAWAMVADVLTFYQERIANEGFLRTAIEDRSLRELASLVGYVPQPGVAASVSVAYTVQDQGADALVDVPAGSRIQSLPVAGEQPKVYETSEPGVVRASWSKLAPRSARAQQLTADSTVVYVNGASTKLKANDPLLIAGDGWRVLRRIASVTVDAPRKLITLTLEPVSTPVVEPLVVKADGAVDAANAAAATTRGSTAAAATDADATVRDAAAVAAARTAAANAAAPASSAPPARRNVPATSLVRNVAGISPLQNQDFMRALTRPPASHPASMLDLHQSAAQRLQPDTDTAPQLLTQMAPALQNTLRTALRNTTVAPEPNVQVFAFNVRAAPFGSNAPLWTEFRRVGDNEQPLRQREWTFRVTEPGAPTVTSDLAGADVPAADMRSRAGALVAEPAPQATESPTVLFLDNTYPNIVAHSWVAVCGVDGTGATDAPGEPFVCRVVDVRTPSRAAYGLTAKTTRLALDDVWFHPTRTPGFTAVVRGSEVFAQSEPLDLADAPVSTPIEGPSIELDDLHDGLTPGQWLIVSGERLDVPDTRGVTGTEVVMLRSASHAIETVADALADRGPVATTAPSAAPSDVPSTRTSGATSATPSAAPSAVPPPAPSTEVPQPPPTAPDADSLLPGGRMRTTLTLSSPLSYRYARDSVTVYGNVVRATHGETHDEILGSGDGTAAFRSFTLRFAPLTYVSAATASGTVSTLQVRVNGIQWQEVKSFNGTGPTDRVFVTRQLEDGTTQVSFGNGTQGASLPPGVENVRATYRAGIGAEGNSNAGQISQLVSRPLGVMDVSNPLGADGGADRESGESLRRHVPQGLASLDRLISVDDYEDFCGTFAGVGKASAVQLTDDGARHVHVTIAGADDAPLTAGSALLVNLRAALAQFGDPHLAVRIEPRDALLLVIAARVKVLAAYQWSQVAPLVSAALLDTFSFARRALGQDVALSEVQAAVQNVPGVEYVDVDVFDRIAQTGVLQDLQRLAGPTGPTLHQMIVARLAHVTRGVDAREPPVIRPAQIAYLSPDIPATLTLTEITT